MSHFYVAVVWDEEDDFLLMSILKRHAVTAGSETPEFRFLKNVPWEGMNTASFHICHAHPPCGLLV